MSGPRRPKAKMDALTTGSITRTLFMFALPALGSSLLQSLNGSINSMWVGRFLGEAALAATSNANLLMFLAFCIVFGFGMAATILIGQCAGRGDVDGVRRVVGTANGVLLVLAIIVAALGWIFAPQVLRLLGTPGEAFALALIYLRVVLVSMPTAMVLVMLTMSLRGIGDSLTPLWFMILSSVLDMALNPLLIRGLGPLPALGIAGSGLATAIANAVGLAALIIFIYRRDLPLRLRGREFRYLWPDRGLLVTIGAKGVPMGLQMVVMAVSSVAMIGLVNRHGVVTTAAYGAIIQLWTYVQMPAMALGAAVSTMAAQNIGAKRWDRVALITRSGVLINLILTGAAVLLLALVDRSALGLFLGADTAALAVASHINLVVSWSFVLFGITMVLTAVVRANGAVLVPLLIMIVSRFPVQIGVAVVFASRWGADAIWRAFPASSIVALLMSGAYYRFGRWRSLTMALPSALEAEEQAFADADPEGRIQPVA